MTHPLAWARSRLARWFEERLPLADSVTLTQRSVYIVPSRAGLMLGLTLLVLLVASINYQLNLGYLLTFLLAGCSGVAMHVAHGTLRGLTLTVIAPEEIYAEAKAIFHVQLVNTRKRPRYAVELAVADVAQWVCCDVPAQASTRVALAWQPPGRGLHRLPTLRARTAFPLGTFRVWTVWRPAAQVLVYPQPEASAPPLPMGLADAQPGPIHATQHSGEPDGLRPYRSGDPLKHIIWKKAAKTGELVSRDSVVEQHHTLWLERQATGLADVERQLSRLCAWVLQADQLGATYGLRLNGTDIAPDRGGAHLQRCLRALALA
ncbi:MAG: hypothetical protein AUJ20_08210 [Comamonadaceae bacterium CG1_02_60_18]|nr:MAG: hypothetical protein AUJ20_08210 [Comamonadaceae bacterium CG1_02_60_18]PIQ55889.1 MAG: DUF58 domain-containing protein [Comamonadaceae bacterium CG12_big_fil_rev_8_21_14_0_65_59_15]